jgi:glutaredoxin-related protein
MQAGVYEKAKQCVNYVKNPEQKEKFKTMIDEKMRKNFKSNNDIDQLVNSGDVIGGLDMLVKQGQYEQCLNIAQKNGIDVLSRYLFGLVNKLSQTQDYESGLK